MYCRIYFVIILVRGINNNNKGPELFKFLGWLSEAWVWICVIKGPPFPSSYWFLNWFTDSALIVVSDLKKFSRCTQLVVRWPDSRLLCPLLPWAGPNCSSELQCWGGLINFVDVDTCLVELDHVTISSSVRVVGLNIEMIIALDYS